VMHTSEAIGAFSFLVGAITITTTCSETDLGLRLLVFMADICLNEIISAATGHFYVRSVPGYRGWSPLCPRSAPGTTAKTHTLLLKHRVVIHLHRASQGLPLTLLVWCPTAIYIRRCICYSPCRTITHATSVSLVHLLAVALPSSLLYVHARFLLMRCGSTVFLWGVLYTHLSQCGLYCFSFPFLICRAKRLAESVTHIACVRALRKACFAISIALSSGVCVVV
jgi:hypothetical protein